LTFERCLHANDKPKSLHAKAESTATSQKVFWLLYILYKMTVELTFEKFLHGKDEPKSLHAKAEAAAKKRKTKGA